MISVVAVASMIPRDGRLGGVLPCAARLAPATSLPNRRWLAGSPGSRFMLQERADSWPSARWHEGDSGRRSAQNPRFLLER